MDAGTPASAAGVALVSPEARAPVLAWRGATGVSAAQFLHDAQALAARLPPAGPALNLCEDRYHFMTAFAAVCLRGQTNLLPPSHAAGVIAQIAAGWPGCYAIGDAACPDPTLAWVDVRSDAGRVDGALPMPVVSGAHTAALAFTSGSTGAPRAHAKTWGSLVRVAQLTAQRLLGGTDRGAAIVATVPPQHMYGLETTVMLAFAGGCAAHAGRTFFPAELRAALEQVPAPRVLVTTPVHLRACLAAGGAFPSLELIVSATAPLGEELAAAAERRLGAPVHEIYGCTEAGSMATRRTVTTGVWELFADMHLERRDGSDLVHAAHLPAPVPLPDAVEDLGAGRFRLLGRNADLLKVAGKRASLGELTAQLLRIPGVVDAAVFVPQSVAGHEARPAALVVAPDLTEARILAALGARVDPVFLPRPLVRVSGLPRNEVGKLPHAALQTALEHSRAAGKARE